jgi:hypothetical protein
MLAYAILDMRVVTSLMNVDRSAFLDMLLLMPISGEDFLHALPDVPMQAGVVPT